MTADTLHNETQLYLQKMSEREETAEALQNFPLDDSGESQPEAERDRIAVVQPMPIMSGQQTPDSDSDNSLILKESDVHVTNPATASSVSSHSTSRPSVRAIITVIILTLVNLLNYMDRFTIAGVLDEVSDYFTIDKGSAGFLQTAFICSYMIFSPIFGYLGDRYNRKLIVTIGVAIWSNVTLGSSYIPSGHFWAFVVMRGLVGIGEASYSTIAPTIIADLFAKDMRTIMLTVFYFAIPVGSGLGYIAGSSIATHMGKWQWSLRLTPALGYLCVILLILVVREPARGSAEGGSHRSNTPWRADIIYLIKNKTFMLSTLGFTCVAFVAGSLSWWGNSFVQFSIQVQQQWNSNVPIIFGVITCLAGFVGVIFGTETARRLRPYTQRSDALVCAFGLIMCAPFLFLALAFSHYSTVATWILIFIAELFMCLNWAIVTDILLYVVIPTRRSTAEAFQILLSHALGDAGSPFLVGKLADSLSGCGTSCSPAQSFVSLQNAMYVTCYVSVLGGGFFLWAAIYVIADRKKADAIIRGSPTSSSSSSSSSSRSDVSQGAASDDSLLRHHQH